MPFRQQQLDTGFNQYIAPTPPATPQSATTDPSLLDQIGDTISLVTAPINPTSIVSNPRLMNTLGAAFRLDNPVLNAVEAMTKPIFAPDPTFDVAGQLKKDDLWDQYRDNFLGVESQGEYNYVAGRIARDNADRNTLARNGLAGLVSGVTAGVASPTSLLPFVGEETGVLAVMRAALMGGTIAAADEIPLRMNQPERTWGDSFGSVAMGTILGGVLGGAHAYLSRPMADIERDMANTTVVLDGSPSAPITNPQPISAGAAAVERPDFRLRPAGPEINGVNANDIAGAKLNPMRSPVVQVLNQDTSPIGRWIMSQLSDGGMSFVRDVEGKEVPYTPASGGTAESLSRTYYAAAADSIRKVDDNFAQYWLGKKNPGFAERLTAGYGKAGDRLNRREFREAVSDALENNNEHDIPEVADAARFIHDTVYKPIGEKAQKLGMFKNAPTDEEGNLVVKGAASYLNRIYNNTLISARKLEFINILADHFQGKLEGEWNKAYVRFSERQAKSTQRLSDMMMPADRVEELYNNFMQELKNLEAKTAPEEDTRRMLSALARKAQTPADAAAYQKELEAVQLPEAEIARQARVREVKQRVRNLNRSVGMANKRMGAKLAKVNRAEELQLSSLNRAVRRAQKFLANLDKLSDKNFDKQISELKNDFADAGEKFDRNEERISKTQEADLPDTDNKLLALEGKQEALSGKLSDITDELGSLESADRGAARQLVQDGLDEVLTRVNALNGRRAVRAARLAEQAKSMSPEVVEQAMKDLQKTMNDRERSFLDDWEVRSGGSGSKAIRGGVADFSGYAKELASATTDKILGTFARLPGHDIMVGDRGPELVRTLDIPAEKLHSKDGASFLERDVNKLVHSYIRTMGPDIEITKKLGELEPESGRPIAFKQLQEEADAQRQVLQDTAKEKDWSQEKLDKANQKLNDQYRMISQNIEGVLDRLRGTRGLPDDPYSITQRLGRIALNANTLRYMGKVVTSSIPDVGRPIMNYGLLRTFGDGYIPLIKGLMDPEFRAAARRELGYTSAAWETVLHTRMHSIDNISDYMVRGSPFEKSLEWATSKMGLIGLFEPWTVVMKKIVGTTAVGKIMDSLELVNGGKGSAADIRNATDFLAQGGIDGEQAQLLWREIQKPGGADQVNGFWWPNTEKWNTAAAETFRQMLGREIDRTIITPGVERPLLADKNLTTRLLFQFRSFGMSSTTKTVLSGLQQRGMANIANQITGTMISLALGTVSYILWAENMGGTAKSEMEDAMAQGKWQKFADEAVSRSGILAQLGDVQDIMSNIPLVAPHVTFSGQKTTRRAGEDLTQSILGPTYGSLVDTASSVVAGAGSWNKDTGEFIPPSQSWVHQIRLLLPLQNLWALQQGFDFVENAAKSQLPRKRP